MRRPVVRPCFAALALVASLAAMAPAAEVGPQGVVREFCRADGLGARLPPAAMGRVLPFVEWSLEPAWDRIVLVTAYEIGTTRPGAKGALELDVRYNVVGTLTAQGMDARVHVEVVTYAVHAPDERGWRIIAPPVPPHVFADRVEVPPLRRLLQDGRGDFLANSVFVWRLLRSAGWNVDYVPTAALLDGRVYGPVSESLPGDLVVYLRAGTPYHVGVLESDAVLVSSTLGEGIVRSRLDAFGGEVRFLRLIGPPAAEQSGADSGVRGADRAGAAGATHGSD